MGKRVNLKGQKSEIMLALARHKYLTRSQIAALGINHSKSAQSRLISTLKDYKIIGEVEPNAKFETYENVLYLKKECLSHLVDYPEVVYEEIQYCPKTPSLSFNNYEHRKYNIDCHIELFNSCNVTFFETDVDKLGDNKNKLERKTNIKFSGGFLEPDAVFKIDTGQYELMYLFEMERREPKNRQQLNEKINKHILVHNQQKASHKYEHPYPHRILMVFEYERTMQHAMEYVATKKGADFWFLFKKFEKVVPEITTQGDKYIIKNRFDFTQNWHDCNGRLVGIC